MKNKPKILFILTPDRESFSGKAMKNFSPQIGVGYLFAYLKQFEIESSVLDTSFDFDNRLENIKKRIAEFGPDVIGITLYSRLADFGKLIVDDIKKISDIPVVAGGPHISSTKDEFFYEAPVDYGIMMDGEIPLKKLINALALGRGDISSIPGLIYRDSDNKIRINHNCELITNLDELPFPDYSGFEMSSYAAINNASIGIVTSRGCPFSCTFCNAHHVTGRKFRYFSAAHVADEIKYYYEKGFREIGIGDDCFNVKLDRSKDILKLIIGQKLEIVLRFMVGMRANFADREFFDLLREAGCNQVGFGLEAGDPEILRSIKKNITIEKLKETLGYAKAAGVMTSVNFIIGHPNETYEQAKKTIALAKSLPTNEVFFFSMFPYKGTEAYDELKRLEKEGKVKFLYSYEEYLYKSSPNIIWPVYESPDFTKREREELLRKGRKLHIKTTFRNRFGKIIGSIFYILFNTNYLLQIAYRVRSTKLGGEINKRINRIYFKQSPHTEEK